MGGAQSHEISGDQDQYQERDYEEEELDGADEEEEESIPEYPRPGRVVLSPQFVHGLAVRYGGIVAEDPEAEHQQQSRQTLPQEAPQEAPPPAPAAEAPAAAAPTAATPTAAPPATRSLTTMDVKELAKIGSEVEKEVDEFLAEERELEKEMDEELGKLEGVLRDLIPGTAVCDADRLRLIQCQDRSRADFIYDCAESLDAWERCVQSQAKMRKN